MLLMILRLSFTMLLFGYVLFVAGGIRSEIASDRHQPSERYFHISLLLGGVGLLIYMVALVTKLL